MNDIIKFARTRGNEWSDHVNEFQVDPWRGGQQIWEPFTAILWLCLYNRARKSGNNKRNYWVIASVRDYWLNTCFPVLLQLFCGFNKSIFSWAIFVDSYPFSLLLDQLHHFKVFVVFLALLEFSLWQSTLSWLVCCGSSWTSVQTTLTDFPPLTTIKTLTSNSCFAAWFLLVVSLIILRYFAFLEAVT